MRSAGQQHGTRLRQHFQARLRGAHGPAWRTNGLGAVAGCLRILQRGASALVVENALTSGVQASTGRACTPGGSHRWTKRFIANRTRPGMQEPHHWSSTFCTPAKRQPNKLPPRQFVSDASAQSVHRRHSHAARQGDPCSGRLSLSARILRSAFWHSSFKLPPRGKLHYIRRASFTLERLNDFVRRHLLFCRSRHCHN